MNVIILILAVSICIAGAFLAAFLWSVKDGQFDDTESPAQRMLFSASHDSYHTGSQISNLSAGFTGLKSNESLEKNESSTTQLK